MLFIFICFSSLHAEDYGKYGNTYQIQEEDLIEYIKTKLQEMDMEKWQNDFKEKSLKTANRPKPTILSYAKESRTYYYDPSITLKKDYADDKGKVFATKGTKINPLDTVSLSNNLIFIDGENKNQVEWALEQSKKFNGKVKIILTNGAIIDLMNETKTRLYFDQNSFLTSKFKIKNIPAIILQENKLLRIEEVVINYD
jgi:conjugal transfer pilus assembly protein TraW